MTSKHIHKLLFAAIIGAALEVGAANAASDGGVRILPIRERNIAMLFNDTVSLQVWKIGGYQVELRLSGKKHVLKLGESLTLNKASCTITFEEAAPETRIARFTTDCAK